MNFECPECGSEDIDVSIDHSHDFECQDCNLLFNEDDLEGDY